MLHMDELPEPVMGAFSRQQPSQRRSAEPEVPFEGLMRKSFFSRQERKLSGERQQQGDMEKIRDKEDGEEKENIPREMAAKNVFAIRRGNMEEEFVMVDVSYVLYHDKSVREANFSWDLVLGFF